MLLILPPKPILTFSRNISNESESDTSKASGTKVGLAIPDLTKKESINPLKLTNEFDCS